MPLPAAPLIAGGLSLISGLTGGKGAKKAAQIQAQAMERAIGEQRRQYDTTRADNLPFLNAGQSALGGIEDLAGLNGADPLAAAIAQLKAGPGFTSRFDTGVDAILQSAAATGGLRGGNTQNSLAQFGSGLLADVIERQLGTLGGLAGMGAGTASNLGQLGQSSANSISQLLSNQGAAKASGVLGQSAAFNNTLNDFGSIFQNQHALSQLTKALQGGGSPLSAARMGATGGVGNLTPGFGGIWGRAW